MKKIGSTILILCMLLGISCSFNKLTLNRTSEGCIQLSDFYELEKDSVDVLFVGSSHVYYSINTCMLYDDYGIASYLLASPGQPVWISYHLLEEAFKTQSPELVVFDVCTLFNKESDFRSLSWETLFSMKPSATKWRAIQAVKSGEGQEIDAVGAFFSFPYYHTRYAQLTKRDFENTDRVRYNGYKPDFTVISEKELAKWEGKDMHNFDEVEAVTELTETYLRKLIQLCQEKDVSLLLVNSPFANQTEKKQKAYNYVGLIAEEYGVPFIDSNSYVEEMQIDFKEDLLEASHLNYYGARKYTAYLAEWMKENKELPDRRGNANYKHWEDTSELFVHSQLMGRQLKEMDTLSEYQAAVADLDDCVIVTWQNDGAMEIYDEKENIFTAAGGQEYFEHIALDSSDLAVSCSNGIVSVRLDNKDYAFTDNGTNLLVYDKIAKTVIDGVGFAENKDDKAIRTSK